MESNDWRPVFFYLNIKEKFYDTKKLPQAAFIAYFGTENILYTYIQNLFNIIYPIAYYS